MSDLASRRCVPCEGGVPVLSQTDAEELLQSTPDWKIEGDQKSIVRKFEFKNFHEAMAFVNAVAFIAHKEDHHPDLQVGYKSCEVRYSTHAVGGLTHNDFICAAKVDQLLW